MIWSIQANSHQEVRTQIQEQFVKNNIEVFLTCSKNLQYIVTVPTPSFDGNEEIHTGDTIQLNSMAKNIAKVTTLWPNSSYNKTPDYTISSNSANQPWKAKPEKASKKKFFDPIQTNRANNKEQSQ